jgi:hypothetical protein
VKLDLDALLDGFTRAEAAFDAVRDLGDIVALALVQAGQPELQERLAQLRRENDDARERRRVKLAEAARR